MMWGLIVFFGLTVMLSPRGRMRRFFPCNVDWRASSETGAASTEAAEQRATRLWMRRMVPVMWICVWYEQGVIDCCSTGGTAST